MNWRMSIIALGLGLAPLSGVFGVRLDAMAAPVPALAAGAQPVLDALMQQERLDGPHRARQPSSASAQLLKTLNDHYAQDQQVLAHYRQALLAQEDPALDDLVAAPNIWADDYVELLAKFVQKPGPPPSFRRGSLAEFDAAQDHRQAGSKSLLLLDRHYDAWARDQNFGPRLRNAYFGGEPHLEQYALANGDETTTDNGGWINAVIALAHTHDPAAVAWLRPYLDNQTVVVGTDSPWVQQSPMPWRACELAHDAILHILGRPGEFGSLTRLHEPRFEGGPNDDYNPQKHDQDIQTLVKYLDTMPSPALHAIPVK